ncbi:sodium:proton antiporter [candidate division KSB1 bacterium]|nr:MAG: sodium:proton antiporter [candidate division KSB1 bacterium]
MLPLLSTGVSTLVAPPLIWSLPFVLILLSIATFPLIAPDWWSKKYPLVVLPLGALSAIYYIFFFGHAERMISTGHEYLAFIVLIGSLFVVSGGIHIRLFGVFTPAQNVLLLAIGAVLANLVGTTGASMILIRPFLRGNQWRFAPFHVVFFIFIVSNCGGALTPVGDPPLFLGYLKGVPFFWVIQELWYKWLIAIVLLLVMFYVLDTRHFRKQSAPEQEFARMRDWVNIDGQINFVFLGLILGAVLLGAYLPEDQVWIREVIMLAAAAGSYFATPKKIHASNNFNFHPIQEVAILFAGIFAAMVPTLDWLAVNASQIGLTSPGGFYWATGITSSMLDNAPSYLNFLAAAMGLEGFSVDDKTHILDWIATHSHMLRSISIAAVFFGAATYIGNGPNFMVKSICDHAGVKTPTFIEYIYKYTLPFLLPVLIITYFLVR